MASLNQDGIDSLVDQLRTAGISIATITRQKLTLEEAFLRLVRGASGDES